MDRVSKREGINNGFFSELLDHFAVDGRGSLVTSRSAGHFIR